MFAGGPAREHAIAVSCRAKAAIVARDERETGDRALLNLGHTFGHAFEAAAGFSDRLLHGEAVALGMALAFAFSARRGLLRSAEADRVTATSRRSACRPGCRRSRASRRRLDRLMELIAQDKKVKRGRLTFILARGIGQSFIAPDVDAADVRAFPGAQARRAMTHKTVSALLAIVVCLRSRSSSPAARPRSPRPRAPA